LHELLGLRQCFLRGVSSPPGALNYRSFEPFRKVKATLAARLVEEDFDSMTLCEIGHVRPFVKHP
jgi:hypothetical protein